MGRSDEGRKSKSKERKRDRICSSALGFASGFQSDNTIGLTVHFRFHFLRFSLEGNGPEDRKEIQGLSCQL